MKLTGLFLRQDRGRGDVRALRLDRSVLRLCRGAHDVVCVDDGGRVLRRHDIQLCRGGGGDLAPRRCGFLPLE